MEYQFDAWITGLKFSDNKSYLRTYFGLLHLQSLDDPAGHSYFPSD
jgi:hypothetical protein